MENNFNELSAFAYASPDKGYQNQLIGALNALAEITGETCDMSKAFLMPEEVSDISQLEKNVLYSDIKNYQNFRKKIFAMLDAYMKKTNTTPRIFITVYNMTESLMAGKNTDKLCQAVKEYYAEHNLGYIFTTVLTSKLHNYKYVDLVNIPKHLLTFATRIRLLQNKRLRKRALITVGIINNFSQRFVKQKNKELCSLLNKLKKENELSDICAKIDAFCAKSKRVVFCLGGRVEGNEIVFDLAYIKKLYASALKLVQSGFGVAFVNGPRTPNDVTDFLYEKSLQDPQTLFQNCKKIAQTDEERKPKNWRIYSGKHEEEFKALQKLGNIYPGIVGFGNTLVVHSADTYASCETANANIPTAISKGLYIDPKIRYDCINLYKLLCPKYAIDFDDFVYFACTMKIEPQDLHPQILSSPIRVFAETVINRFNKILTKKALTSARA